jgi:hypothetical protein
MARWQIQFGFLSQSQILGQIREGSFNQALHVASFFTARERLAELQSLTPASHTQA